MCECASSSNPACSHVPYLRANRVTWNLWLGLLYPSTLPLLATAACFSWDSISICSAPVSCAGEAVITLEAAGNALASVPPDCLARLRSLTYLDLSKNSLASWPLPLSPPSCLQHLAVVLLMHNRSLPALPCNAFDCCAPALTRLDLSGALQPHSCLLHMAIHAGEAYPIPAWCHSDRKTSIAGRWMVLRYNCATCLLVSLHHPQPCSHHSAFHDSTLHAGCARIANSLESLAACTSLKHLCISGCSISTFPPSISALGALTSLLLSDNGIAELPIAPLATLNNLEEFDIRNNALTQLPPQLALMPKLRSLSVEGNILRTVRRTVLERGSQALLEYLKTRLPA
jgi:hypothetical protein